MENIIETDYVRNLTILAVTGEFGFGEVIGIGAYMLEKKHNIAEVAFSVSRGWQGKGIAFRILEKLADAAKENGIAGLVAYTEPKNQGMIRLFRKLPCKILQKREDDIILLSCRFDEKPDTEEAT